MSSSIPRLRPAPVPDASRLRTQSLASRDRVNLTFHELLADFNPPLRVYPRLSLKSRRKNYLVYAAQKTVAITCLRRLPSKDLDADLHHRTGPRRLPCSAQLMHRIPPVLRGFTRLKLRRHPPSRS